MHTGLFSSEAGLGSGLEAFDLPLADLEAFDFPLFVTIKITIMQLNQSFY